MSTVIQGEQTKLKHVRANPKPDKLKKIEADLQSKDYFEKVLTLQICDSQEDSNKISESIQMAR